MQNWFLVFPYVLLGLCFIPVFFIIWTLSFKKAIGWRFASLFALSQGNDKKAFWGERLLFTVVFILFLILLARPAHISSDVSITQKGVDIMFVVDISKSMITEDIAPNRIEAAKKVLTDFTSISKGNRIGCVIFAGKPFLVAPPTFDTAAMGQIISAISTDSINQNIP